MHGRLTECSLFRRRFITSNRLDSALKKPLIPGEYTSRGIPKEYACNVEEFEGRVVACARGAVTPAFAECLFGNCTFGATGGGENWVLDTCLAGRPLIGASGGFLDHVSPISMHELYGYIANTCSAGLSAGGSELCHIDALHLPYMHARGKPNLCCTTSHANA